MAASLDDQMAALDSALAGGGPPPIGTPGTVHCQVCDTTIDTTTGEPVEAATPPSAPLAPPPLPI